MANFNLNKKVVHKEPVQFDRSGWTGLIDPTILILLLQYYMGNMYREIKQIAEAMASRPAIPTCFDEEKKTQKRVYV
jgi:hypothetical protein